MPSLLNRRSVRQLGRDRRAPGEGCISEYVTKSGVRYLIKYSTPTADGGSRKVLRRGFLTQEMAAEALSEAISEVRRIRTSMNPNKGTCFRCDGEATSYTVRVEFGTLRRRKIWTCWRCQLAPDPMQDELRAQRAKLDWTKISDPIDDSLLRPDEMPEQYAGPVRASLRAFAAGDASEAVVLGLDAGTLNASIAVLGLSSEVYAEQRSGQTVLRKVA